MNNLFLVVKKYVVYIFVVAVVIVGGSFLAGNDNNKEETLIVHPDDFVQEVSVSGRVIAAQNVDLVFSQAGRVSGVYATVGDTVQKGNILASLENGDVRADVLQKEAAYDAAQARLNSLKEGTRLEQIAVTESKVVSAQITLDQANQTLVDAVRNAYTQSDDAIRRRVDQLITNPRSSEPEFSYTLANQQLKSDIEWGRLLAELMLVDWSASITTLSPDTVSSFFNTASKNLEQTRMFLENMALAVNALSAGPALTQGTIDGYKADITTARSNINTAVTTLTSAVTSQKNAEISLVTAERNLDLELAGTSADDLAEQEAKVKSAEADLLSAQAKYEKTLVRAPFTGIVTRMDARVGGSASSNASDISMIGTGTLQVESFVPEINTPLLAVGDEAIATLDAYGEEVPFALTIISIDPAETIRDGVSTYRIKLQFVERDQRVKSGMTANITVTTEKKSNVITVPQGIVFERDGKKYVLTKENEVTAEREVTTGEVSSFGTIEILSGLLDGDIVVLNGTR